jgi:hypothetical protein
LTAEFGLTAKEKTMELKYVRHSQVGFILWPRTDDLWHAHIGGLLQQRCGGEIVSAGFARLAGGKAKCWGKSESLGIASKPDDSAALAAQLSVKTDGP